MNDINIENVIKKELKNDHSGHDFKHIERVVNNAKKIVDDVKKTTKEDIIWAESILNKENSYGINCSNF